MNASLPNNFSVVVGLLLAGLLNLLPQISVLAQSPREAPTAMQSRPLYLACQQALDLLTRAEIAREEAELATEKQASSDKARQRCRSAIQRLLTLESRVAERLRETYEIRPSRRKNTWTIRELESLLRNLKVQIARGYRNQALCYEPKSIDHINSLNLALEQLSAVIMQPLEDTSVWSARVEQIVCLRLSGRFDEAEQLLSKWQSATPPAQVMSRLAGEQILLALDTNDLERALSLTNTLLEADESSQSVPETDDAVLQALLAAQRMAPPERAARMMARAQTQLQLIDKRHGPYWLRRGRFRLGQAMLSQLDSRDPELLRYAATRLEAVGQATEAIAVYDRIATLCSLNDNADLQFDAMQRAAALTRSLPDSATARKRFRHLAVQHATHEHAPAMHLLAIEITAKLIREAATKDRTPAFERYIELLQEHLRLWPDQPSVEKVRDWLANTEKPQISRRRAQQLARTGQREIALELYRSLAVTTPNDLELQEAMATLLAAADERQDLTEAMQLWTQIENRSQPATPRWSRARRARLKLMKQLGQGEQAEKLRQLTAILYPAALNEEAQQGP